MKNVIVEFNQGLHWNIFTNSQKVIHLIRRSSRDSVLVNTIFRQIVLDFIEDDKTVVCAFDFLHKEGLGSLSLVLDYRSTVLNRVPFVAKIVKNVAAEMYVHNVFENFDDFQIIGFSLGTHIAGVAARLLQTEFGATVPRIFGKYHNLFNLNLCFKGETKRTYFSFIKLLIRQKDLFLILKIS